MGGLDQARNILAQCVHRYRMQLSAMREHVEIKRRIGTLGRDDAISRHQEQRARQSQESVDAFADHHAFDRHAVVRGNRGTKLVVFGIGVFPILIDGVPHHRQRLRRGAKDALIGA